MKPIVARANTELRTTSTRELAITGLFVSLIAAGSQISIPLGPVPFTLQVFFVFLTSAILPAKKAFLAQFLYLLLGFFGFPVFSGFRSGLPVLFGPTGGFLLSFPFVAFLTAKARSFAAFQALCLLGLGLLYLIGGFWLGLYFGDVVKGFMVGVLPFFGWDLLKVFLVVRIAKKIGRYQNRVTEQVIAQQNGFYRESAD
ncbi:MAG TPA: biotin transporter BioY [Thermotogota bacterium]|nr:biotin transporter BioY [Thermotogota bacterium]HNT94488.1 biotin transporter BioY [Thermotogota bacterium]HOZ12989.1 biotin transporter BioY [Thermotogota bacterium]HPB88042.1 biotin transporter BioY [Thermotogota bacterium]HPH09239.1 biotin transporter BioY [Thermotogota bacterium]